MMPSFLPRASTLRLASFPKRRDGTLAFFRECRAAAGSPQYQFGHGAGVEKGRPGCARGRRRGDLVGADAEVADGHQLGGGIQHLLGDLGAERRPTKCTSRMRSINSSSDRTSSDIPHWCSRLPERSPPCWDGLLQQQYLDHPCPAKSLTVDVSSIVLKMRSGLQCEENRKVAKTFGRGNICDESQIL